MAKKKKSALFSDVVEQQLADNVVDQTSQLSAIADTVVLSDNAEQDDENDELETLRNEIKRLNAENSQLIDKLAAYIDTPTPSNDTCISAELDKLKYENSSLRNENDTYLMKISELTFENAKLNSQLQQLSKNASIQPTVSQPCCNQESSSKKLSPIASSKVPYARANGYVSWN